MWNRWDAIVFDLDGTLVELIVDWEAVDARVSTVAEELGLSETGPSAWEVLAVAKEAGCLSTIESIVNQHEIEGAKQSLKLPLAESIDHVTVPVGVCSLNCEEACRIALNKHDLAQPVRAIVGRDTTNGWKPDPGPLLYTIDKLDADPQSSLFIGDSPRDKQTAERAGVPFRSVQTVLARERS